MAANDGMNASGNANQNGERPIQLAQAGTPNLASSGNGPNVVHVTPPAPGAREEITVLPGQTVVLDGVDLATARVERVEGGLLITLADGGVIFLAGFADAAGSANPPHIEIPGLGAIEASQLLAAADANVSNIQPAAGPGAGGAGGGLAHGGGAGFGDVVVGPIGDGLARGPLGPQADFTRGAPEPTFVFGPAPQDTTTPASVAFSIAATPGSVREEFGWNGSGSEGGPVDTAHYTVTLTGTLGTGQHASVVLNNGGTATVTTDYSSASATGANFDTIVGTAVGGVHVGNTWTNAATGISYDGNTNTLTFTGGGATSLTINIAPVDDSIVEGTETAIVTLSNPSSPDGAAVLGVSSATVNITETDHVTFNISADNSLPAEVAAIVVNGNTVIEGDTAHYTVSYTGTLAVGQTASVQVHTADGTAVHPADFGDLGAGVSYNAATGVLTFTGGGATSVAFTVPTVDDTITEGTENFTVNLSSPSANGVIGVGTATTDIIDNDHVTFNITGDTSVNEGTTANYSVNLVGTLAVGQTATVQVHTADGTAVNPADFGSLGAGVSYNAGTGVLTFTGGGATSVAFTVPTVDDSIHEGTENFSVNLSNPSANGSIGTGTVTTDIVDNDTVALSLSGTTSVTEGGTANYAVTLNGVGLAAGQSVTMTLDSASGTATEVTDFAKLVSGGLVAGTGITISGVTTDGVTGAVTFTATNTGGTDIAAGATLASVSLATVNDTIVEGNENFTVSLSSAAAVSGSPVTTTITDNDTMALSLSGTTSVTEGGTANYAVTLNGVGLAAGQAVTMTLDSASGTATEIADFAKLVSGGLVAGTGITISGVTTDGVTGAVTFTATNTGGTDIAAGATLASVSLATVNDTIVEGNENFTVSLSSAAAVSGSPVTTTITDNDTMALSLSGTTTVAEGGTANYAVTLNGVGLGAGQAVTMTLDSASGTATEIADFAKLVSGGLVAGTGLTISGVSTDGVTGAVTFTVTNTGGTDLAAGATLATVSLATVDDAIVESSENFTVSLSSAAAVSGSPVTTTITDNDTMALSLSGSTSVTEGSSAAYSVSLSGVSLGAGQAVTFTLDSASGTATEIADFAKLVSGSITAGTGITLSGITTDGVTGAVTVTATNTSGSTITAGSALATVSLATVNDTFVEGNENFTVSLASSATVTGSPVTTTITDNDTMALTLSGSATVVEGNTASYAVALNGVGLGAGQAVTMTLDSASGTATEVTDFAKLVAAGLTAGTGITISGVSTNGVTGAVTFTVTNTSGSDIAAGATLASVNLTTVNDTIVEGNENFTVSLSSAVAVTGSPVTTTITDNDTMALTLSGSATVVEGNTASYAVALNGVGLGAGQAVTMTLDSASGTATEVTDFAKLVAAGLTAGTGITISNVTTDGITGAVTFTVTNTSGSDIAAGATLASVNLTTVNDTIVEGNENFTVSLSSAAAVTGSPVTTTITDNDAAAITLSGTTSVVEGNTASYAVALNGVGLGAGKAITFTLDSASGTATEVTDFAKLLSGALTGASGITLSGISVDGVTGAVTVTATNTSGSDIAAGANLVTFSLATVNDTIVEGNENFTVSLSSAATVTGSPVTTTITDNDTMALSLSGSTSVTEGSAASYSVTLNGVGLGAGQSVSMTLDSASGTATEITDFAKLVQASLTGGTGITLTNFTVDGTTGAVTFTATNTSGSDIAAGSTLATVSLGTVDDAIAEGTENFTVSLTSAATVTGSPVTTNITDNDALTLTIGDSGATPEGSQMVFSVHLSNVSDVAQTYQISSLGSGTNPATPVTDYNTQFEYSTDGGTTWFTAASDQITFAAGTQDMLIRTLALTDAVSEPNETLTVSASLVSGHTTDTTDTGLGTITDTTPNILDGTLITNSNQTSQLVTLTFSQADDPDHQAAKIYDLSAQGQQGSILQNVGFNIDGSETFNVTLEATSGTKAIVTDFTLETQAIKPHGGTEQLQLDDTSSTSSTETAFTAVITPDVSVNQSLTKSTDGSGTNNTLTDASPTTLNYLYGASGNDTLNGSSGADVLNGGPGTDTINGNGGNDLIVYDPLDHIDGGTGIDTLRIDQGAIALTQAGSGSDLNTLTGTLTGAGDDFTVNITGKDIQNIEYILITEEAGADSATAGTNPNDDVGTNLVLDKASVLSYSATDTLTVLGSMGDVLTVNNGSEWNQTPVSTTTVQGQTLVTYHSTDNTATLIVDGQVHVNFA